MIIGEDEESAASDEQIKRNLQGLVVDGKDWRR